MPQLKLALVLMSWITIIHAGPFNAVQAYAQAPTSNLTPAQSASINPGPGSEFSEDNVDLSSGKVSLSIPVAKTDDFLSPPFEITLNYNSNSLQQFKIWNVEAPTSDTGLGFQLSTTDKIIRLNNGTGNENDDTFIWSHGATTTPLSYVSSSSDGDVYAVTGKYSNTSIIYKKKTETSRGSWIFVHADGRRFIYGGENGDRNIRPSNTDSTPWKKALFANCISINSKYAPTAIDPAIDCTTDPVEHGVIWGNWIGPSGRNANASQQQIETAWNLSSIANITGLATTLSYVQVIQSVGTDANAKSFSKASYLYKVVSYAGKQILINYCARIQGSGKAPFSSEVPAQCSTSGQTFAEYTDPFQVNPEPDGYQERLRTLYVQSVDALTPADRYVGRTTLQYKFLASKDQDAHMAKRLLSGIDYFRVNQADNSTLKASPSYQFHYWGDAPEDNVWVTVQGTGAQEFDATNGALYGALKSITTPDGLVQKYTYAENRLTSIQRRMALPETYQNRRLFWGTDYAIAVDGSRGIGTVATWTPQGWKLDETTILDMSDNCKDNGVCLGIMTSEKYFAFATTNSQLKYVYKDIAQFGIWKSQLISSPSGGRIWKVRGNKFFVAFAAYTSATNTGSSYVYYYKITGDGSLQEIDNQQRQITSFDVGDDYTIEEYQVSGQPVQTSVRIYDTKLAAMTNVQVNTSSPPLQSFIWYSNGSELGHWWQDKYTISNSNTLSDHAADYRLNRFGAFLPRSGNGRGEFNHDGIIWSDDYSSRYSSVTPGFFSNDRSIFNIGKSGSVTGSDNPQPGEMNFPLMFSGQSSESGFILAARPFLGLPSFASLTSIYDGSAWHDSILTNSSIDNILSPMQNYGPDFIQSSTTNNQNVFFYLDEMASVWRPYGNAPVDKPDYVPPNQEALRTLNEVQNGLGITFLVAGLVDFPVGTIATLITLGLQTATDILEQKLGTVTPNSMALSSHYIIDGNSAWYRATFNGRTLETLGPLAPGKSLYSRAFYAVSGFVPYTTQESGLPKVTWINLLRNGHMSSPIQILDGTGDSVDQTVGDRNDVTPLNNGGTLFATYRADASQKLETATGPWYLYNFSGDNAVGPVVDYVVDTVSSDDGAMETVTRYTFEETSASFNGSGIYSRLAISPSAQSGNVNGTVEYVFLNGNEQGVNVVRCSMSVSCTVAPSWEFSRLLSGTLHQKTIKDNAGSVIKQTTYNYLVNSYSNSRFSVLIDYFDEARDGLEQRTSYHYNEKSQQTASESSHKSLDPLNKSVTEQGRVHLTHYAYEEYPQMSETNQLDAVYSTEEFEIGPYFFKAVRSDISEYRLVQGKWIEAAKYELDKDVKHDTTYEIAFTAIDGLPQAGRRYCLNREPNQVDGMDYTFRACDKLSSSQNFSVRNIGGFLVLVDSTGACFRIGEELVEFEYLANAVMATNCDNTNGDLARIVGNWIPLGSSNMITPSSSLPCLQPWDKLSDQGTYAVFRVPDADGKCEVAQQVTDTNNLEIEPRNLWSSPNSVGLPMPDLNSGLYIKVAEVLSWDNLWRAKESTDVTGLVTDRQYPAAPSVGTLPIMITQNAQIGRDADYYGGEVYEKDAAVRFDIIGAEISTDGAYTGEYGIRGAAVGEWSITSSTFTRDVTKSYIAGAWIKLGAGASCAVYVGGVSAVARQVTGWQYVQTISLPSGDTTAPTVRCNGNDAWVDDFRFNPIGSRYSASVYDPWTQVVTANHRQNGETTKIPFDEYLRSYGPYRDLGDGTPQQIVDDLVMQGFAQFGGFDEQLDTDSLAGLNTITHVKISSKQDQIFEAASDLQGSRIGSIGLGLRFAFWAKTAFDCGLAACELRLTDSGNPRYTLHYDPDQKTMIILNAQGAVLATSAPLPTAPTNLAIIAVDRALFVYANSKLVLSQQLQSGSFSTETTTLSSSGIAFSAMIFGREPIISQSVLSNRGRELQKYDLHSFSAGATMETRVSQVVYDGWGQPAIMSLPMAYPPSSGPIQLLDTKNTVVKGFDWSTGVMTGDVVDYYKGNGIVQEPGDADYPYVWTNNVDYPLNRPKAQTVAPGSAFSMSSTSSVVLRRAFNDTAVSDLLKVAGVTDEDRSAFTGVTDKVPLGPPQSQPPQSRALDNLGLPVAARVGLSQATWLNSTDFLSDDVYRNNIVYPPISSLKPFQAINTSILDPRARAVIDRRPDKTGEAVIIRDEAGRIRFVRQNPDWSANSQGFTYVKYDMLGRAVELGVLKNVMHNLEEYKLLADDVNFPPPEHSCPIKMYYYDIARDPINGSLLTMSLEGRLFGVKTWAWKVMDKPVDNCADINYAPVFDWVFDYQKYDDWGSVVVKGIHYFAAGRVDERYNTGVSLDTFGRALVIQYPTAKKGAGTPYFDVSGQFEIFYQYDELGRIQSICKTKLCSAGTIISNGYTYDVRSLQTGRRFSDGNFAEIKHADLSDQAKNIIVNKVSGQSERVLDYAIDTTNGSGSGAYYNGLPVREQILTKVSGNSNVYNYVDGRLESAAGQPNSSSFSYDANGNITNYAIDDGVSLHKLSYVYSSDQKDNRLLSVVGTGGWSVSFTYDDMGHVISRTETGGFNRTINFVRDSVTGRPFAIFDQSVKKLFGYDRIGNIIDQRTIDQSSGTVQRTAQMIYGFGTSPLVRIDHENGITKYSVYIFDQGSTPLAVISDVGEPTSTSYYLFCDYNGTPRIVFNGLQNFGVFEYTPFGFPTLKYPRSMEASTFTKGFGKASPLERIPYRLGGAPFDADFGLYFFKDGIYDSAIGRYLTNVGSGIDATPYAFANNRPISLH